MKGAVYTKDVIFTLANGKRVEVEGEQVGNIWAVEVPEGAVTVEAKFPVRLHPIIDTHLGDIPNEDAD